MHTEILKLDNLIELNMIDRAADIIRRGGLVVFPTETVYGLGGDATNPEASAKIYAAKGRPSDNPLIIHIARPEEAEKYAYVNETYYKLASAFMPGPLTVVMRSKDSVPRQTRGGLDTVAVRCPSHPLASLLIERAGVPIAAPSANISGTPSPTAFEHVLNDMNGRVDMIINGGNCDIGIESTIVKIDDNGSLTLLRPGKITEDELRCVAGEVTIASAVVKQLSAGEVAESPGMKYKHYAPKSPVALVDGDINAFIAYVKGKDYHNSCVICYEEDEALLKAELHEIDCYTLGKRNDECEQARHLFDVLRRCDNKIYNIIYAPTPEKRGVGLALYNRMIRAAAHRIIKL